MTLTKRMGEMNMLRKGTLRKLKWNLTETLYNGVKYADNTEVDKYSIVRNVVRNVNDEINDYLDGYLDFGSSDHLY